MSQEIDVRGILAELERRERAKVGLADFARYMLDVEPADHHVLICDAMDALLGDEYDELIILAPPGSAKSHYTSIALPTYFMGRYPKGHILTASYSVELAEKWGRRVRNLVDTEKFFQLFGVSLSKDSIAAGRWATAEGGEFYGAGVGSGILGFRADLAVIDDPISGFEEAQSNTQLKKIHAWYETDFVTRLKPNAKVVLICQRLARFDVAGYMIDRNLLNPTRRQRILKLPMECNSLDDPLGRKIGDRLWPEWFTPEMVIDAKRDDFKWKTLYQQEPPADEGAWVSTEQFKFAPSPEISDDYTYYGMTDLALSVNTGDYTVHIVVAAHNVTGLCHVVDFYRKRVDPDESAEAMVAFCSTYDPEEWMVDDDNASKVWMQLVATRARKSNVMVNWKPYPVRGQNKETRAAPLRGMFKRGMIYFDPSKPWTNVIVNECLQFPNALGEGIDDCVDALSLLGRRLVKMRTVNEVTPAPPRPTLQSMTLNDLWAEQPKRSTRI